MCRVQLSINAISWINLYPVDNTVDFVTASPQHSNLSGPSCSKRKENNVIYLLDESLSTR